MASGAVTARCSKCGRTWKVWQRADGTYPATVRCAKSRGGCSHVVTLPRPAKKTPAARPAAAFPAALPAEVITWDPPSDPLAERASGYQCAACRAPVMTEERGIALWCSGCGRPGKPPGVAAPYQRGGGVTRAARSQRELDLEAVALARRKGVMLAELGQLAADARLHPESRPVVEWFADQVRSAATGGRLDELAALLPEAGIRRRHFWQGRPALPGAGDGDHEDDCEDEDDGQGDEDTSAGTAAAAPRSGRMSWADALASCGWTVMPADGRCQIGIRGQACGAETARCLDGATWACAGHYEALCGTIAADFNRRHP